MCGLARTSHDPESTFLLLGGDVCHFPGAFRPSLKAPLPDPIPEGVLDQDSYFPNACPCSIFTDNHPRKTLDCPDARTTPFYLVSTDDTSAYIHPEAAQRSVNRLISFDVHPNVMVCLAHDETLLKKLPTLNNNPNDDLNSWKSRGYKDKVRWGWLNDMPRNGQAGKKFAIEGFWRNGLPWPNAKNELRKKGEKILSSGRVSIE